MVAVAAFATAFLCVLVCVLYAWSFYGVAVYDVSKSFYFLVLDEVHIEASTAEVQYDGGAGFLLEREDSDYIALSVYLQSTDGEAAKAAVSKNYESAEIVTVQSGKLYMKSASQKKLASEAIGALDSLYGCMQVLDREIARLAGGATQASSKRILRILEDNFTYLGREYEEVFSDFSSVCESAAKTLESCTADIVYVKDLRFLLCELCVSYTDLCGAFSL